jgi:hypothetical protein
VSRCSQHSGWNYIDRRRHEATSKEEEIMTKKQIAAVLKKRALRKQKLQDLIESLGYKTHGKPRVRENGSIYQCYRRGYADYVWLGNWFVEHRDHLIAMDYHNSAMRFLKEYIDGAKTAHGRSFHTIMSASKKSRK